MSDLIKDNTGPTFCINESLKEPCLYIRVPYGYSVFDSAKNFMAACCDNNCSKVVELKEENKKLKAKLSRLRTAFEKAMEGVDE
jgi:hypothetical protein